MTARVLGVVPSIIITHYLEAFGEQCEEALLRDLRVDGDDARERCRKLLAQDEPTR